MASDFVKTITMDGGRVDARVRFAGDHGISVDTFVTVGSRPEIRDHWVSYQREVNGTRIVGFFAKSKLALTEAEGTVFSAASEVAQRELLPDYQLRSDRRVRKSLVQSLNGAYADRDAEYERLYAREDERAYAVKYAPNVSIEAARQALAAFDAAHPEVLAAIEADRKETVERHMWD